MNAYYDSAAGSGVRKNNWRAAFIWAAVLTFIPLLALALMAVINPLNTAFRLISILFLMQLPGEIFAGIVLRAPHGPPLIGVLLIAIPFNFALYTLASYGVIKSMRPD